MRGRHLIHDKFKKRGILAKIHHTLENVASWEYCFPRYITLQKTWHKPAKLGYDDKTPPLSSGSLGKMQSSDLKTVLGTLRFARVPRTVFEVLGLHLSKDPLEKGGVLAQDAYKVFKITIQDRGHRNVPMESRLARPSPFAALRYQFRCPKRLNPNPT